MGDVCCREAVCIWVLLAAWSSPERGLMSWCKKTANDQLAALEIFDKKRVRVILHALPVTILDSRPCSCE